VGLIGLFMIECTCIRAIAIVGPRIHFIQFESRFNSADEDTHHSNLKGCDSSDFQLN
jgi:hypothetical protein